MTEETAFNYDGGTAVHCRQLKFLASAGLKQEKLAYH